MLNLRKIVTIEKKIKTILIVGLFALVSNLALGASDIKKVKRLVARLQMEILELKKKSSNSASEQMAILEPQNEKIESSKMVDICTEQIHGSRLL